MGVRETPRTVPNRSLSAQSLALNLHTSIFHSWTLVKNTYLPHDCSYPWSSSTTPHPLPRPPPLTTLALNSSHLVLTLK